MQFEYILFGVIGLFAVRTLFLVIKNKGFRGALFGAPLRSLVSEMDLEKRGLQKTKLKVHILDPHDAASGPHVGIEVTYTGIASWQVLPIALTRVEAQQLADQLSAASREAISAGTRG